MAKETFVLTSITKPEFEVVAPDISCTSMKIKKDTGKDWGSRFQVATAAGEATTFKFYSHLGYVLEAPITNFFVTEYADEVPYDVLDIYVRLTPEQLAQIIPPEISAEFGY